MWPGATVESFFSHLFCMCLGRSQPTRLAWQMLFRRTAATRPFSLPLKVVALLKRLTECLPTSVVRCSIHVSSVLLGISNLLGSDNMNCVFLLGVADSSLSCAHGTMLRCGSAYCSPIRLRLRLFGPSEASRCGALVSCLGSFGAGGSCSVSVIECGAGSWPSVRWTPQTFS